MASENQSFADLWVDFLLKETEEREKRESAVNPEGDQNRESSLLSTNGPQQEQSANGATHAPNFGRASRSFTHQTEASCHPEEVSFSLKPWILSSQRVPPSSENGSQFSRLQPRYS